MARGRNCCMVLGAMSRPSRNLLRYGVAAAFFAGGVAFLAAGWSAAFAWTLIVVSLVCATQAARTTLAGPPSGHRCGGRAESRQQRVAKERRHRPESRRPLSHRGRTG